jgi:hypothetical protein
MLKFLIRILVASVGILVYSQAVMAQQMLPGHVPEAIGRLHLPPTGRLAGTNQLHLVFGLPLRQRDALTHFLDQLYDPASPLYRQYLTPEQFTEQYGPTPGDYQAVINFARENGLEVTATHGSRIILDVRGRASDVEAAFHVTLHTYQHPTEAREFYAPDVDPTVDPGLAIQEISGLDNFARLHRMGHATSPPPTNVTASGSGSSGNYLGKDFRNAYIPGSALAGSGQIVGLYEDAGYYASDITAYEKAAGMTNIPLKNVQVDGAVFSASSSVEVPLDIEMAIAMAPALAGVYVFEAPSSESASSALVDTLEVMATNTPISQFSSSMGYAGNPNLTADQYFQKMAAQGQSFFQASGDGDAWTSTIYVPAASPYVTVVGGTTLTMSGSGQAYTSETVWNSGNSIGSWSLNGNGYMGSGGGVSSAYSIPAWQTNINMTTNHGSTTQRNIPDVAMVAYGISVEYNNGTATGSAGTSAAAPLWAGFTALINQQAAASHKVPVGFLNPALYAFLKQTNYATLFHDITTGSNTWSGGSPKNYYAAPGYDLCTGLGTPNGTNLINALVAMLGPNPSLSLQPANQTVAVGGSASFSVTAVGTTPFRYFWRNNAVLIPGATNAAFTTNNVLLANSGAPFTCVVTNTSGSVTSAVATLTVYALPAIQWSFTNLVVPADTNCGAAMMDVTGANFIRATVGVGAPMIAQDPATNTILALGTNSVVLSVSDTNGNMVYVTNTIVVADETPPVLTSQPPSQTNAVGGTATFALTATACTPLSYQWYFDSAPLAGQTGATLTLAGLALTNSGNYVGVAAAAGGATTSSVAVLTVEVPPVIEWSFTNLVVAAGTNCGSLMMDVTGTNFLLATVASGVPLITQSPATNTLLAVGTNLVIQAVSGANGYTVYATNTIVVQDEVPPVIAVQPLSQTNLEYATVSLAVTATACTPLSYQWYFDSDPLADETNATMTLDGADFTDAGDYFVVVTAAGGVTTSAVATLTVLPASCAPPPTGLVAWWPGNDSATDIIGGDNGVWTGGGPSYGAGEVGPAFSFNGSDNLAVSGNTLPLGDSPYTIEAWIYPTIMGTNGIIGWGNYGGSFEVNALRLTAKGLDNYWWGDDLVARTPNLAGNWHHVAATYDGTTRSLYLDGALIGQDNPSPHAVPYSTNGTVGVTYGTEYFIGLLDEVAVYATALTARQIANVYSAGSGGKCVPTPPTITVQPTNQVVVAGGAASFGVTATGSAPLSYFWRDNGALIPGATAASFTTNQLLPADSGAQFSCVITNPEGAVTSQVATLTVILPPAIQWSFTNLVVAAGANCEAAMTNVTGTNYIRATVGLGVPVITQSPAANAALPLGTNPVVLTVSDAYGNTVYSTNTIVVQDETPPVIVSQPQSRTNLAGSTVNLALTATACTPLTYQWYFDNALLTGQTNATLTLAGVAATNAGNYAAVATAAGGATTSAVVTLTVTNSQPPVPVFSINLAGTNLVINGLNGVAGGTYVVLMSTNLTLPINQWTRVVTNVLGTSGDFTLTATNAVNPNTPEQFYLLQAQ